MPRHPHALIRWAPICLAWAALAWPGAASAQTDALVVDESGRVGIVLVGPDETLSVTAALHAPYVKVPRKCQRGPVPVRIVVSDAETGENLLSEQAMLSVEKRQLTATFDPCGGFAPCPVKDALVQVAVLTSKRTRSCIESGATAIGPAGFRTLAP